LNQPIQGYGWEAGDLCRSSLCVAVSCEILARVTGAAPREIAYTAGLIHDVGKLALAYTCSDALAEVLRSVPEKYATWEEAEKAVLGFPSSEVSKKLLQRWGFGHGLIEVAANHLHPSRAGDEDRGLVTVVHAAKHLAAQLGYGVGADGFYYEVDEAALEEQHFQEETIQSCIPEVIDRMEQLVAPDLSVKALEG
jgi:HD-like signal output (HDOD) protein